MKVNGGRIGPWLVFGTPNGRLWNLRAFCVCVEQKKDSATLYTVCVCVGNKEAVRADRNAMNGVSSVCGVRRQCVS